MNRPQRKAAFLDRDGVINADRAYLHRPEDFDILPGVLPALRLLAEQDHALIVVTNQSGIARGFFDELAYDRLCDHMRNLLASESIHLDAIYHCPHHPEASVARYRLACDCRKPAPGLLRRAADELVIDLAGSLLVGDKPSDIAAGRAAGVGRCYLVGSTEAGEQAGADAAFPDLLRCVRAVCLGERS
jgi:D-glycero-D-manno-heptose 1,7-bisphosphate phosphatase